MTIWRITGFKQDPELSIEKNGKLRKVGKITDMSPDIEVEDTVLVKVEVRR